MSALLEARGLSKVFRRREAWRVRELMALGGVDLRVDRGETVAVVGESGSGKTTLGRCLLRLVEPSGGEVRFDGTDLLALGSEALRSMRRRFQPVFQDPAGSLDPRMRVGATLSEPMATHGLATGRRAEAVAELLRRVGLPADAAVRYPHEFSGGQRQRLAIARALVTDPELVVADEPVSSLDGSVRAQILNLLADLQSERGLALVLIAHDLAMVEQLADRVMVMLAGRIVEEGPSRRIFASPQHPYTSELLAAVPEIPARLGSVRLPSPAGTRLAANGTAVDGCPFFGRCPLAEPGCRERPPLALVADGHRVACHFPGSIPAGRSPASTARNFSSPLA